MRLHFFFIFHNTFIDQQLHKKHEYSNKQYLKQRYNSKNIYTYNFKSSVLTYRYKRHEHIGTICTQNMNYQEEEAYLLLWKKTRNIELVNCALDMYNIISYSLNGNIFKLLQARE